MQTASPIITEKTAKATFLSTFYFNNTNITLKKDFCFLFKFVCVPFLDLLASCFGPKASIEEKLSAHFLIYNEEFLESHSVPHQLKMCIRLLQHVAQMPVPVDLVFIHHTAMSPCNTLPSCSAEMRAIQNFHMDDRGKNPPKLPHE